MLMDSAAILNVLAHRYPFLLVDSINVIEPGRHVEGIKRVTGGEWFGAAWRPQDVAMPNTLAIEALAQTSAALLLGLVDARGGVVGYFAAIERVRLREPAVAGDTLLLRVELESFRRGIARLKGRATVDGRRVATASFTTIVRAAA
jgi:3-hydroxyacyl-[acyl-carrier-protein] dehydratase